MDCCLGGIKGCAKILAPILIPCKLCCGSKTSSNNKNFPKPPPPAPPSPSPQPPPSNNNNPSPTSLTSPPDSNTSPSQPSPSEVLPPLPTGEYEVFLSFRGGDTRHQIAEFLSLFLKTRGVRAFIDDNHGYHGDEIGPSLTKSIEQSKIYIPILSENFADSKWCLKELAKMVECQERDQRHVIYPIFYMVEPTDVKNQTGPYQKAFQQYEDAKKISPDIIKNWKHAMRVVGHKVGRTIKSKDANLAVVIDGVASFVLRHLNKNESVSYADIRETQKDKDGNINLQKKLISQVMIREDSSSSINMVNDGIKLIKDRLSSLKLLVVLDDVDDKFRFEDVLGDPKNFSPGSRFLFTSRDKTALIDLDQYRKLYEVQPMNEKLSCQVFLRYAFHKDSPITGYENLTKKFVQKIGGVPLTLRVMGSSLLGKKIPFWEGELKKLRNSPNQEVKEILKISYDSLDPESKQVFLDIACFYIGIDQEKPSYMWSDLGLYPEVSITILDNRSLIKLGYDDEFQMHDQLRDMGRAIVRDENPEYAWMRSRVWDEKDALEMLRMKKGSNQVKALRVDDAYNIGTLTREHFLNLQELRYYDAGGATFGGDCNNILPNIRWLSLRGHKNKVYHPANFHMENLTANRLKVLDLSGCSTSLTKIPEFPQSWSLEVLNLSSLELSSGLELDVSNLRNLKVLNLHAIKLERIVGGTIGTMEMLRELDLSMLECNNLEEVVVDIGELSSLQILKTTEAEELPLLGKLPTSLKVLHTSSPVVNLSELVALEELMVVKCDLGLQIPTTKSSWWSESKLKFMMLKNSNMVPAESSSSSSSCCRLPTSLTNLHVWDCSELKWLPNLENLENLTDLFVDGCGSLQEIQGLDNLLLAGSSKLESVSMTYCPLLTSTFRRRHDDVGRREKRVESMKALCIVKCGGGIPHLSNFPRLTSLEIGDVTDELAADQQGMGSQLDGIANLEELKYLSLFGLSSVDRLPSLSKLRKLTFLSIHDMPKLREIEGLADLKSLNELVLAGCTSLERLRLIAADDGLNLKELKGLDIRGCKNLPPGDLCALKAVNLPSVHIKWPHEPYEDDEPNILLDEFDAVLREMEYEDESS
ncbi:unnamed protein product [Linum tenue]|uniref:TIR domain-containing protein n=1 Tax=Linum tenue TaxID=586396 RepID=A0AAV0R6V6_9ROSI|nr:unnamed protein product [Linum tenue]